MRKRVIKIIVIGTALTMLTLNWLPFIPASLPMLSIPGLQQNRPKLCETTDIGAVYLKDKFESCYCTDKGVTASGFPFRSNMYDACSQNEEPVLWIKALNTAIIALVVTFALFVATNKRLA